MNRKFTISELGYELYKLNWLNCISVERKLNAIKNWYDEYKNNHDETDEYEEDIAHSINNFIEENGYNGELYVCYDEFLDNEYKIKKYMRTLFNDNQYAEYLMDLKK